MSDLRSVCVFCASSTDIDDLYKQTAAQVGRMIAAQNLRLVYGGAHVGLMGIAADAALAGGGEVVGVIPENLKARELMHTGLTQLHVTQTMQERQKMMADLSDAFVVLPGGLGTLAEFFEVLTWKQLGLHEKRIIILNIGGYWDGLLAMIDQIQDHGFSHGSARALFEVVDRVEMFEDVAKSLKL